jgi:hypothetical protein
LKLKAFIDHKTHPNELDSDKKYYSAKFTLGPVARAKNEEKAKWKRKKSSSGSASRKHLVTAPPVALQYRSLQSQLHKGVDRQVKDSRITRDEPYVTPRDWAPPRG